ncbi:DUF7310 family coiled-coil domain-containing protein [Haloarchaeobius sp. DT45]|uniref:DUF7310 family coiled-coil domain-containing protein n=1 Tax=Haloarchaeobius sp. DT45 TaxID=3446116 RepID=UPI003F6DA283
MSDQLDDRLRAVERAITDDDSVPGGVGVDGPDSATGGEWTTGTETRDSTQPDSRLTDRLDEVETTVAELEAAVQALRGYAGNVRSVNERVEQRADGALAAVESLEARVEDVEADLTERDAQPGSQPDAALAAEWSPGRTRHRSSATSPRAADTAAGAAAADEEADPYTIPNPDEDRDRQGLVARVRELL